RRPDRDLLFPGLDLDIDVRKRYLMAQRYQFRCSFCSLNACDPCDLKWVSFWVSAFANNVQCRLRNADERGSCCFAGGRGLFGNIHHPDVSCVVIMRQFIHKKRTSATSPSLKVVNFGTMTKASAFANETRSDDPIHGSGTAINLPSAELASRAGK